MRWIATVYYRSANGLIDIDHDFEEIEELHDIVERGPDWHTIDRIEVRLSRNAFGDLTLEQALLI